MSCWLYWLFDRLSCAVLRLIIDPLFAILAPFWRSGFHIFSIIKILSNSTPNDLLLVPVLPRSPLFGGRSRGGPETQFLNSYPRSPDFVAETRFLICSISISGEFRIASSFLL
ncbi:MAG: hypothetical protein GDA56_24815 [Hormoscilla sp. GM7CHS1pb]|nr:hypothetical protein [Hormoscilla sp. GM7CHS1pb]